MPAILLGIVIGLLGVVGIGWFIYCLVDKEKVVLPSAMIVVALAGLFWLLVSVDMPLEIQREEFYTPTIITYDNGIKIQTIRVHSETINTNDIFGGQLAEDKAVKKVYFKEWYAGLWYSIESKYFIIDKEKNVEKTGVKTGDKQP